MTDFLGIALILYSFCMLYRTNNILYLVVCTILFVIYIIKYFRLRNYIETKDKNYLSNTNKQTANFIDILNHDIKIPVLAQLRTLQIVLNTSTLEETCQDLLKQTENSCQYVLDMISMLTSVYNFEQNNYIPHIERFCISDLITQVFEELSITAREKNITFSFSSNDNAGSWIEADKTQIKKVILNFLYDALNYSQFGGNINVNIISDNYYLKFIVSGMSLISDNKILDNNYHTIGHTIGMNLSKKIIEFHNGQIYFEDNNNPHKSFIFKIPRKLKISAKNFSETPIVTNS